MAGFAYKDRGQLSTVSQGMDLDAEQVERVITSVIDKVLSDEIERAYEIALEKVPVRKVFKGGKKTTRAMSMRELATMQQSLVRTLTPSQKARLFADGTVKVGNVNVAKSLVGRRVVTHRNKMTKWGKERFNPHPIDEDKNVPRTLKGRQGKYIGTQALRRLRLVAYHESESSNPPWKAGTTAGGVGARFELPDAKRQARLQAGTGYVAWGASPESPEKNQRNSRVMNELLNSEGRRALRDINLMSRNGQIIDAKVKTGRDGKRRLVYGAISSNPDGTFDIGGNLRKSIVKVDEQGAMMKRVKAGGARAYYASYMEFGTRHVAARPFLRPALASVERTIVERLQNALKRLAKGNEITW